MSKAAQSLEERFLDHISPEPMSGCWLWNGPIDCYGYGRMGNVKVHRFSYELHLGEIADGLCVCHRCDMPECGNPAHLFAGTSQENTADKVRKNRCARGAKTTPKIVHRGSRHPRAKLTEADVIRIRSVIPIGIPNKMTWGAQGRLVEAVAKEYNISTHSIRAIIYRYQWRHV